VASFSPGQLPSGKYSKTDGKQKETEEIRMGLDRKAVRWVRTFGYLTLTCLLFLVVQSRYAFGQVDEGAISGTIQDTTGAVVPSARVTLLNKDQGISLQTNAGNAGEYSFSPVRIGHYYHDRMYR
jgi:hypothetical protein